MKHQTRTGETFKNGCVSHLKMFPPEIPWVNTVKQGPRSKFSSGGAKEECVKENFLGGGGAGGACLWISIQFL